MISGIVAQEMKPLPRGVFSPVRLHADNDNVFFAIVTSGLDQRLFPQVLVVDDEEEIYLGDLPIVLNSDAILYEWQDGEVVFRPVVARDLAIRSGMVTDLDGIFRPDIRIPGTLQPQQLYIDGDQIFPTPLILDPGMWRAESVYVDIENVFSPSIDAALGLFPQRVIDSEVFYNLFGKSGVISPPFYLSDDQFFNFSTLTRMRAGIVIDSGVPVLPATTWDGQATTGVTVTSDGLTATHTTPGYYDGARSTLLKSLGKYYFEIIIGPSTGAIDASGLLLDGLGYVQMSQFNVGEIAVFNNYSVFGINNFYAAGTVITNNTWYVQLGHAQRQGTGAFYLVEGDVIGMAFNMDDKVAWFRLNGGPWNNNQWGNTVLLNQGPDTGIGGIPVPAGRLGPAVCMGGAAGSGQIGNPGDNITANFGAKPYRSQPPVGFLNWDTPSPFGIPFNGDSFGAGTIGIPATLNGTASGVGMSNGNLTATHNTTSDSSGVQSASSQNYGKYYFEFTIGATHGNFDSVGILIDSLVSQSGFPEGSLGSLANGSSCCNVFLANGNIYSLTSYSGKTLGQLLAGDVVGMAVDLTPQSKTQGGVFWIRMKRGANISGWNADTTFVADPVTGAGSLPIQGFSYQKTWVPCVGFSGFGNAIGDNITANFGATPYAMVRPNGYSIWPVAKDQSISPLLTPYIDSDDQFPGQFIELGTKTLRHPTDYVHDEVDAERIFPTRSLGGNLLVSPNAVVPSDDNIFFPGYFATLDSWSSNVTMSNGNLTATMTSAPGGLYTGARSSAQQISGKFYFEYVSVGAHSSNDTVGILSENGIYKNMGGDNINCTVVNNFLGVIYSNNANQGRTLGSLVAGDLIGCAIDLDLRRAWFNKNGGLWNGVSGQDPASGLGGVSIQPLSPFAPAVGFSPGTPINDSFAANFGGGAPYVYPAPLGFGRWSGMSLTQPSLQPILVPDDGSVIIGTKVTPAILLAGLVPDTPETVFLITAIGGLPTIGPRGPVDDVLVETIYPFSIAPIVTSFDSGFSANTSLSTDGLTATHTTNATDSGSRSTTYKTSGKFYFEVTMTTVHGAFDCVGIITQAGTYGDFVTSGNNCAVVYRNTGAIYSGNASSGKTLGPIGSGEIISVAVDLTARKAWFRKGGGLWNGLVLGSENPNTGIGGVTIPASGFAPAVGFGGSGTLAGDAMTANFGGLPFNYAIPSGFITWPSSPPRTPATMDGASASVTMSNGNLTATLNAVVANAGVISTASKLSGKYYFEATIGATHGQADGVGLLLTGAAFNQPPAGQSVSMNYSTGNSFFWSYGGNYGNLGANWVPGDIIGLAFDLDNRSAWFRKKTGAVVGNWNNQPAGNPATNSNAAPMAPGAFGPCVAFGGSPLGQLGDNITVNFGQSAYVMTPPAGFGNWMT